MRAHNKHIVGFFQIRLQKWKYALRQNWGLRQSSGFGPTIRLTDIDNDWKRLMIGEATPFAVYYKY